MKCAHPNTAEFEKLFIRTIFRCLLVTIALHLLTLCIINRKAYPNPMEIFNQLRSILSPSPASAPSPFLSMFVFDSKFELSSSTFRISQAIFPSTQYKVLLHGQAVGWGQIAALHVSLNRGLITQEDFDRMAALVQAYGPLPPFKATAKKLVALTASDKKRRSGRRAFVLTTGSGTTYIVFNVTDAELLTATQSMLDTMSGRS